MGKTSKEDRHFLFHGELSDAPGRDESWNDHLRYRGNNRWEVITEGTDFSGLSDVEPTKKKVSTSALVSWALERDAELQSNSPEQPATDYDDSPRQLGSCGERLREIAVAVDAHFCVACLDGWLPRSWPPTKKHLAVRILDINGVTRRGMWIRIYHSVFDVATNLGPAFLYPPGADRTAKLILKTESSMSTGRMVKVPKKMMAMIEAFQPDFKSLRDH